MNSGLSCFDPTKQPAPDQRQRTRRQLPMNLYLMRHGLAVERGSPGYDSDRERPLTAKGERRVRSVAGALRKLNIPFNIILSSPLVRAHQTAEVLNTKWKPKLKVHLTEHLAPEGSAKELLNLVRALPAPAEDVLLVGHEPDLSELASLLLTGGDGVAVVFKKGGVAKLSVAHLRPGRCATLEWLLTSRQLEMMA